MARWTPFPPPTGKQHATEVGRGDITFANGDGALVPAAAEVLAKIEEFADPFISPVVRGQLQGVLIRDLELVKALQGGQRAEFLYATGNAVQQGGGTITVPFTVHLVVV
jgi:hypothetical protein